MSCKLCQGCARLMTGLVLLGGAASAQSPAEPRVAALPESGPSLTGPSLSGPGLASPVAPAPRVPEATPPQIIAPAPTAAPIATAPITAAPTPSPETVAAPVTPAQPTLADAIEFARASQTKAKAVRDYTCTFVKRELLGGKLSQPESMLIKVRQQPFSVYLACQGPVLPAGQEVIYVAGRNNGLAFAHTTGLKHRLVGTLTLEPKHPRMMDNNLHPITELGIHYLLDTLVTEYEHASGLGPCDVKVYRGVKIDGREATCVQVAHPKPHKDLRFHVTRVYYDQQLGLPVRWEAYGFPTRAGTTPPLIEEYTYRGLKPNVGLTEADFDPRNRAYRFY